jgi:hypothetical protein
MDDPRRELEVTLDALHHHDGDAAVEQRLEFIDNEIRASIPKSERPRTYAAAALAGHELHCFRVGRAHRRRKETTDKRKREATKAVDAAVKATARWFEEWDEKNPHLISLRHLYKELTAPDVWPGPAPLVRKNGRPDRENLRRARAALRITSLSSGSRKAILRAIGFELPSGRPKRNK